MEARRGQAQVAMPFILLVSGIVIEITIAGSFIAYFLATGSLGERLALRASAAAYSGIRDAMIRITRDKEFGAVNQNYNFSIDNESSVAVSVGRTIDSFQGAYIYTVTSIGTVSNRQRRLQAVLIVRDVSGYVQLQSLTEIPAT